MSSRTVPDLASSFNGAASGEYSHWAEQLGIASGGFGVNFGGFYIGENIVLTAAHGLFDVRYTVDVSVMKHWTLFQTQGAGLYNHNKGTVVPWSYSVPSPFYSYVNTKFAASQDPYKDAALANYDLAVMTASTAVATRDLIGAAVFFGTTGTNAAAIGSAVTLEYRLSGTYGTLTGTISSLGGTSAGATFHAQEGMSGGGWTSAFRAVDPAHKYVIGVQSADSANGALGALLDPATFYNIMNTLAAGKSGSQAAQPTNYLHGSDNGETINGTFRPDVVYGNLGNDIIDDGDVNKTYYANESARRWPRRRYSQLRTG